MIYGYASTTSFDGTFIIGTHSEPPHVPSTFGPKEALVHILLHHLKDDPDARFFYLRLKGVHYLLAYPYTPLNSDINLDTHHLKTRLEKLIGRDLE